MLFRSRASASKCQALEFLRRDRHEVMAAGGDASDEKKMQIFNETIEEIEGMKEGAFAPFWDQPVVRSILYSTGGLGLGSLLQTLPQFF